MGYRFGALIAGVGLAYGGLIMHLYTLQLSEGMYYRVRAASQYGAGGRLIANRGTIYMTDRSGNHVPVAVNKDFLSIFAVPKLVDDAKETANRLAVVLGGDPKKLERKLATGSSYELLMRKAPDGVVSEVETLGLKGIYVTNEPSRNYPMASLAAQTIGFVAPSALDDADHGRYGIEKQYDASLGGSPGSMKNGTIVPPESGNDLYLTIDPTIQIEADRILQSLVKTRGAKGGSIIVEDPKSGKLLAIANVPTFDLNEYGETPLEDFLNPVTQSIYEPGSVFKVLTMSAGIDSGNIKPETTFYDSGTLTVSGRKIQNWDHKAHGTVTMTNVIEESINTGAAFAERETGHAVFKNYMKRFGFMDTTGVDLPGEVKGDVKRLFDREAPAVLFATASYGQGVAVTPLHVVQAIASIANGGFLMRPYVNADLGSKIIRRTMSPETAKAVTNMMVSAVDKAKIAQIANYSIAGKTGTAFVPDFKNGGYTEKVVNTYVGFGPTSDAQFIILIKLDEPQGAPLAGTTVVPAFHDLAQFILNYYNVPPDRLP